MSLKTAGLKLKRPFESATAMILEGPPHTLLISTSSAGTDPSAMATWPRAAASLGLAVLLELRSPLEFLVVDEGVGRCMVPCAKAWAPAPTRNALIRTTSLLPVLVCM